MHSGAGPSPAPLFQFFTELLYRPVSILARYADGRGDDQRADLDQIPELFSEKGYDATSVREICEAAGLSKPTSITSGSKEGVYRALVDESLESFRKELLRVLEGEAPARDRLRRVSRLYLATARARSEQMRFIFGLIHNPPSSAPRTDFPRFYADLVEAIAKVVDQGVRKDEFCRGPRSVRTLVLMGALGEAIHGFLLFGRPELTPALADTLVETIVQGWSAA
jgi:TetR/AcrR family transcriptional regulator